MAKYSILFFAALMAAPTSLQAFQPATFGARQQQQQQLQQVQRQQSELYAISRRDWMVGITTTAASAAGVAVVLGSNPQPAQAVGPIRIDLLNPKYTAIPCPRDKPIPGEKAMLGMRPMCVTVDVDLANSPEKPLEKIGVYGYVTDKATGESVLANNPDGGTDAGQFAIIPEIKTTDKKTQFEFIAAVPREVDMSKYELGIAPLDFSSLRVVSYPGGQQYGAISPCEMNEFSDECEAWEAENGPYKKQEYMIKSNPRTKGY